MSKDEARRWLGVARNYADLRKQVLEESVCRWRSFNVGELEESKELFAGGGALVSDPRPLVGPARGFLLPCSPGIIDVPQESILYLCLDEYVLK